jgi:hypothetical protein
MNDIDQKIQAALRRGESADGLGDEPNITEEVLNAFRGRHRWLSALVVSKQIAAMAGLIFATWHFYHATDVAVQLRWGGLGVVLLVVVALIKIWFWLEMQTNRVLREVKRVELRLVSKPSL